ncbi:hypothetical protein L6164_030838 [Bauhinia variegata]|uniref:Uncharacterized protein n=1 Tax=Bauhinia variegata TaxID=167791 RepID=A0ACB9LCY9_BAUVA|nr:hypothetical protein L6164_030838 [Bauhinia variegata]
MIHMTFYWGKKLRLFISFWRITVTPKAHFRPKVASNATDGGSSSTVEIRLPRNQNDHFLWVGYSRRAVGVSEIDGW